MRQLSCWVFVPFPAVPFALSFLLLQRVSDGLVCLSLAKDAPIISPAPSLPSHSYLTQKEGVHRGCPGILLGWIGSSEAPGHKGQAEGRQGGWQQHL